MKKLFATYICSLQILLSFCFGQTEKKVALGITYSPAYNKASFPVSNFNYTTKPLFAHNLGFSFKCNFYKNFAYHNYVTYNKKGGLKLTEYDLSKQIVPEIKTSTQKTIHNLVSSTNFIGYDLTISSKIKMSPLLGFELSTLINTINETTIERVNKPAFYSKQTIDRKSSTNKFLYGICGGLSISYQLNDNFQLMLSPFFFNSINSLNYNNSLSSATLSFSMLYNIK